MPENILPLIFVSLLTLFCVLGIQAVFRSYRKYRKTPRSRLIKKIPEVNFPFEKIQASDKEKIIAFIKLFPYEQYRLYSVPDSGYFFLDEIDDFIKNKLKNGLVWEPHIHKKIKKFAKPGSVVLDIGSHIGTQALNLSQAVGAEGRVLVFEPQPKIFRELFLNMAMNRVSNIDFYWAGVGDHRGTIELGNLISGNEGGTQLSGGTGQEVELLTIDSLQLTNVSLIKIDVERMEEAVLDGARQTILNNKPVMLIEIMGGKIFHRGTMETRKKILHTIEKIEALGYRVILLREHDYLALPRESQEEEI